MASGAVTATIIGAALILAGIGCPGLAHERTIDLRDCPLDTVTFVDPWVGGSFSVSKVGTNYSYFCDGALVKKDRADATCRGPLGDLILMGTLRRDGRAEPEAVAATWTVTLAAPCCGWRIRKAGAIDSAGVTWLDRDEMPTLRALPFMSIEGSADDMVAFGNEKYATACRLPR